MHKRFSCISEVRGIGLLLGIVMADPDTGQRNYELADRILYAALERGLSFKVTMSNIITLMPPLTITEAELDAAMDILEACLSKCTT